MRDYLLLMAVRMPNDSRYLGSSANFAGRGGHNKRGTIFYPPNIGDMGILEYKGKPDPVPGPLMTWSANLNILITASQILRGLWQTCR